MHRFGLTCVFALAACGRIGFDEEVAGRRKPLTFRAPITGDVPDLPVAIIIDADPDLVAAARPDGADLAVVAADGVTVLPMEIERWDPASGALVAWTRLPALAVSGSTAYLHYGGPPVADRRAVDVWAGYRAVWHLNEDPTEVRSSSESDITARAEGPRVPTTAAGVAGGAVTMDGIDDLLSISDPDGSLDVGSASFSYSVWVRVESSGNEFDMPWYNGGASVGDVGYDLELGTSAWSACVGDGGPIVCGTFGDETEFLGRWAHLVAVIDRGTGQLRTFANAVERGTKDTSALGDLSTTIPASIGNEGFPFRGTLDELRIFGSASSLDRIIAEHANLADRSFLAIGEAENVP